MIHVTILSMKTNLYFKCYSYSYIAAAILKMEYQGHDEAIVKPVACKLFVPQ